ncbi:LuxR C-terminal-related transcriptional regulator [Streptomyces sp. NPDC054775]
MILNGRAEHSPQAAMGDGAHVEVLDRSVHRDDEVVRPGDVRGERELAVNVAVFADDELTRVGAVAVLGEIYDFSIVQGADADVVVAISDTTSEGIVSQVEHEAGGRENLRIILVTDSIPTARLARLACLGAVSVLVKADATYSQLARSVGIAQHESRVGFAGENGKAADTRISVALPVDKLKRSEAAAVQGLSSRDVAVLELLAEGLDTSGIARRLSYSEGTIKNIVHGVVRSLGACNRTQAVALGIRWGIM